MDTEATARWRTSDSAGTGLVLVLASAIWTAMATVLGLLTLLGQLTRPADQTDTNEEL